MKDLIKVMKALADPGRIKMLSMLEKRELCVCELQAGMDLAQPTISKHLKILEEAGLVDKRREAQFVIYFMSCPEGGHASTILREIGQWAGNTMEIRELMERMSCIKREELTAKRSKNESA